MGFSSDKCLKFQALEDNCIISLGASKKDPSKHYYFSKDGSSWSVDSITIDKNEFAYVKGTEYPANSFLDRGEYICDADTFSISKPVKIVSGNIMSLLDDGGGGGLTIDFPYGFYRLFDGVKNLKAIHKDIIPATTIAEGSYNFLFAATGLTEIPENLCPIGVINKSSHASMFSGCKSLVTIPKGVITMGSFLGFTGCRTYERMFSGCTSLTCVPKGVIPTVSLQDSVAFKDIFNGCTHLNEVHVSFADWGIGLDLSPRWTALQFPTTGWLTNVASTGSFYCDFPEVLDAAPRGVDHIPVNWNVNPVPPAVAVKTSSMIFNQNLIAGLN